MQVTLLGPVACRSGNDLVPLGGRQQRAVFALLALAAGRVVAMDRMIDEIWPDEPPARATVTLRAYISRLRRLLPDPAAIVTRPPGWKLVLGPEDEVDAVVFGRQVDATREALEDPTQDRGLLADRLGTALDAWSGEALADLGDLPFAVAARHQLEERRRLAAELWLEARLGQGESDRVVEDARRFVLDNPYRERGWRALMLALYASGRQAEALAAYAELRTVLADDLGLDPAGETRRLEEQILRQDPDLDRMTRPTGERRPPSRRSDPTEEPPGRPPETDGIVGRQSLLGQLDEAAAHARRRHGRLLIVDGPAGLGKTTLVRVLARRFGERGGLVLIANGVGGDPPPALWPWVTLVRQLAVAHSELEPTVAMLGLGRAVDLSRTGDAAVPPVEPTRAALYRGVIDLLAAAAAMHPLLVVVDDLQWVDQDSLLLLALAVNQLEEYGVLFVGAVRGEEQTEADLAGTIGTLRRDLVRRLTLPPLDRAEVHELVARLTDGDPDPELVAVVHGRTLGNPLFVTELVRLLSAEGRLTGEAAQSALPVGIREVLQRRIDRLPAETVTCLTVAALTSSGSADLSLLAAVTGADQDAVVDWCEPALLTGLFVTPPDAPASFALSHDLLKQTLLSTLPGARRLRWHAKLAAGLQTLGVDGPEEISEVARHLSLAAPAVGAAAAVPYLVAAAEDALSRYANVAAEQTLVTALGLVADIADAVQREALRTEVAGRLASLRAWTAASVVDEAATDALPRPTEAVSAASWLSRMVSISVTGRYAWASAEARRVLDHPVGPPVEMAARFVLGWTSAVRGELATAQTEFSLLNTLVDSGAERPQGGLLSRMGEACTGWASLVAHARGDEAGADVLMARSFQHAADSVPGRLNASLYARLLDAYRGDRVGARDRGRTAQALAREIEYAVFDLQLGVCVAWSEDTLDLSGAPAGLDRAVEAYAASGIALFMPAFTLLRAEAYAMRGDRAAAVRLVAESRRLTAELGEVCTAPRLSALAAELTGTP